MACGPDWSDGSSGELSFVGLACDFRPHLIGPAFIPSKNNWGLHAIGFAKFASVSSHGMLRFPVQWHVVGVGLLIVRSVGVLRILCRWFNPS